MHHLYFAASITLRLCLMTGVLPFFHTQAVEERLFSGNTQGTTYSIKVCAAQFPEERENVVWKTISTCLDDVDRALSTYRPDSEISRFNRFEDTTPFKASAHFLKVMRLARDVSEASGGAFDVTVSPLVKAWGFGPDGRPANDPSEAELAALRDQVGYTKIEIDEAASTLRKTMPGVTCDVNAIAQGYTSDVIAAAFDALGYHDYMIEVGGEVKTHGVNSKGYPWRIGIEKPVTDGRAIQLVVRLEDTAVSTSGDYRNYYEENGVRLSHHIDPRTGHPIAHTLASVSVIHPQCALADAYATAFSVLGPEAGSRLAVKLNFPVLFIVHTGPDTFETKTTPAFEEYIEK